MLTQTEKGYRATQLTTDCFDHWGRLSTELAEAPVMRFQQGWLPQKEEGFQPGRVRLGFWRKFLVVFAEMEDHHVTSDHLPFNACAFTTCDTFEFFLRPLPREEYYEFHVTPTNSVLQLRFPSEEEFRRKRSPAEGKEFFERCRISKPVLQSRARVLADHTGWCVALGVPLAVIANEQMNRGPVNWLVSFGRYDHDGSGGSPVISSTSPHEALDFHRQREWTLLELPFPSSS